MPGRSSRTPEKKTAEPDAAYGSLEYLAREAARLDAGPPPEPARKAEPEKEFASRLKQLREYAELSQEELSQRTKLHDPGGEGLSRPVISMYERGKNRPGMRELRILCDTLAVSPNQLLYGTESPFRGETWQALSMKSPARYFARWLYLLKDLDTSAQYNLLELILELKRPSAAYMDRLDDNGRKLLLRLAEELQKR